MAKGIYIVITHSARPSKSQESKWEVHESCEFVDRIKDRHNTSATAIIDYLNKKVIKDRSGEGTYDDFIAYAEKSYPEQMASLKEIYGNDQTE